MTYYSSIYKKVKDYFDDKNYDLNRTFKVNVKGDKTEWSLENKLLNDGKLESELKASVEYDQDTYTLTASNKDPEKDKDKENPKFEWKTKRFGNYFDLATTLKQTNVEFEVKKPVSQFNVGVKSKYDWDLHKCTLGLNGTYVGVENLTVGTNINVERDSTNNYKQDYDLGAQYEVNRKQIYSLLTEKGMAKLKAGAIFKFDRASAYAQYIHVLKPDQKKDAKADSNKDTWSFGLQQTLNDVSSISFVLRHDFSASLLYSMDFPKNRVNAQVGLNYSQFEKEKNTLGWKVVLSP